MTETSTGESPKPSGPARVSALPTTKLGWWSVGLAVAFVAMMILNGTVFMELAEDVSWRQTLLPFFGIGMMLCGLVSGILGVVAVARKRERSILVLLPALVGLFVIMFVAGEFLFPH